MKAITASVIDFIRDGTFGEEDLAAVRAELFSLEQFGFEDLTIEQVRAIQERCWKDIARRTDLANEQTNRAFSQQSQRVGLRHRHAKLSVSQLGWPGPGGIPLGSIVVVRPNARPTPLRGRVGHVTVRGSGTTSSVSVFTHHIDGLDESLLFEHASGNDKGQPYRYGVIRVQPKYLEVLWRCEKTEPK